MADSNDLLIQSLAQILEGESSEEMRQVKFRLLQRIAEESEVKPSRIPAPLNITEVGGYYNLIADICADDAQTRRETQLRLLCAALGLPV